jgi:uncharacterized protein (DUF1800 family)
MLPASELAIALNRFGLGARPDEALPRQPKRWLIEQLSRFEARPETLGDVPRSGVAAADMRGYVEALRPDKGAEAAQPGLEAKVRRALRGQFRDHYAKHVSARVEMALTAPAPFAERLVHFWANHFAVSADKLQTIALAGTLEFEAVRPHLLGRFEDLLLAVVRHPAMLIYLDQAQSIGPDSRLGTAARRRRARLGTGREVGLNENLAREILELHTLGVAGGYGQADVQALAGGLTGWSVGGFVRRPIGISAPDGAFVYQPSWHQPGAQTLLGERYGQSGEAQGRAMLTALARHPATARHVCTKLARHFVADVPPPALVARLVTAWTASKGDLRAVYRALVNAPEAWAPAEKFKTPWEWTVSALRGLGLRVANDIRFPIALAALGQPVWRPGSPAGWDDVAASWAAPDGLMRRVELAGRLAARTGNRLDARALAPKLLPGALSDGTARAIAQAESPAQALALLLVSPEFMRRV